MKKESLYLTPAFVANIEFHLANGMKILKRYLEMKIEFQNGLADMTYNDLMQIKSNLNGLINRTNNDAYSKVLLKKSNDFFELVELVKDLFEKIQNKKMFSKLENRIIKYYNKYYTNEKYSDRDPENKKVVDISVTYIQEKLVLMYSNINGNKKTKK